MMLHRNNKGITLLELLVVIMIVGILAAIAIPSYNGYLLRARRADAKTVLEQVRAAQEMWRAERGCYARDNVDCQGVASAGTAETKLITTMGVPASPVGDYAWAFTVKLPAAFTARATPNSARQTPDGWLQIDQNGTKTDQAGLTYPNPQSKWSK
jgi:type IV pilus assembly protein PilE